MKDEHRHCDSCGVILEILYSNKNGLTQRIDHCEGCRIIYVDCYGRNNDKGFKHARVNYVPDTIINNETVFYQSGQPI